MQDRKKGTEGITLMEILVVLAIISMLAAAVIPVYNKARLRALVVRTQATIHSIEAALSMYTTDFGDYPPYQGSYTSFLVDLLQGPVESSLWKGPYMRFKEKDIDEQRNIVDAWGTPVYYGYPQSEKTNVPYLLFSAGPDRKIRTGDDIGNW
ncbi:MAG TPA: type II secretion system protein GspG [bacterium]|nr:type II secretion system protein GspG [bacterium]